MRKCLLRNHLGLICAAATMEVRGHIAGAERAGGNVLRILGSLGHDLRMKAYVLACVNRLLLNVSSGATDDILIENGMMNMEQ